MGKINILDKYISNRIAAGEVVEKPASVVKELVENSIDAGADKIIIEIEEGGIKRISIKDNGYGIEKEDLKLAFMPHATSKIKAVEDLDCIATLGFRGEALASISAVSDVTICSKTKEAELGSSLRVNTGEFGDIIPLAMNFGTEITVNNLFYNTPARYKFLRKSKTEEGEITDLVEKLILANPNLSFRYVVDGKIKYDTAGNGLYSNIYTIYGKETIDNVLEVNLEREGYSLYGYIGKPEISKPNRTYQTLIVNGRVVRNAFVSAVVAEVYENFLMKNKFPFFVLSLNLPGNSLDVNVHPNKMEVKFENLGFIRNLFNNAVYTALMTANFTRKVEEPESNSLQKIENSFIEVNSGKSFTALNETLQETPNAIQEVIIEPIKETTEINSEESRFTEYLLNAKKKSAFQPNSFQESIETSLPKVRLLGVLFKTYILVEKQESLYLIDQHAAHERQLYDKFTESIKTNNVLKQGILDKYTLKLNAKEYDYFLNNMSVFSGIGFEMEDNGNGEIDVLAVPYMLNLYELEKYFNFVRENLNDFSGKGKDYFKTALMQHACKMAIKSGQVLSLGEIEILLNKMGNGVLLCPHGRPIVVEISKNQIEKWFKRIL